MFTLPRALLAVTTLALIGSILLANVGSCPLPGSDPAAPYEGESPMATFPECEHGSPTRCLEELTEWASDLYPCYEGETAGVFPEGFCRELEDLIEDLRERAEVEYRIERFTKDRISA